MSEAQRTFNALPDWKKIRIAEEVFKVMEYNQDGSAGVDLPADGPLKWVADTFGNFGVDLTGTVRGPGEDQHRTRRGHYGL